MQTLTAGLDLGSTGIKMLVADAAGRELLVAERPTPWRHGLGASSELDAAALVATVRELLEEASGQLTRAGHGFGSVQAMAISGMGESGLLVDPRGTAVTAAIAWYDPRGLEQVAAMPTQLRDEFPSRTGLPLGAQVSVAKLLHLRDHGLSLSGLQWLGLPEFVVTALGGPRVAEFSLASRTGLLDQDTACAWPQLLAHLGVGPDLLPPLVDAGTDLGPASVPWLPPQFVGARLTVAGHDHLVAASASGASADGRYYASFGTAEVLIRILDEPLSPAARARLAGYFINYVRHVVPGSFVLVAGVKTGLLMRRALQLSGITDRRGRDRLDEQVMALPPDGCLDPLVLSVSGARNDDGILSLTIRDDGVSPAELFAAVLRHGNAEIERLVDAMDREVPAAHSTVLSGGWSSMRSVQRARAAVLPNLTTSTRTQDTSFGAALIARRLVQAEPAQPSLSASSSR